MEKIIVLLSVEGVRRVLVPVLHERHDTWDESKYLYRKINCNYSYCPVGQEVGAFFGVIKCCIRVSWIRRNKVIQISGGGILINFAILNLNFKLHVFIYMHIYILVYIIIILNIKFTISYNYHLKGIFSLTISQSPLYSTFAPTQEKEQSSPSHSHFPTSATLS